MSLRVLTVSTVPRSRRSRDGGRDDSVTAKGSLEGIVLIKPVMMEKRKIKVLPSRLKETTDCIQAVNLPDFPMRVNATLQNWCPTKGPMLEAWSQLGT